LKTLHLSLFVALLGLSLWLTAHRRAPRALATSVAAAPSAHTTLAELALPLPGAALVATLDLDALRGNLWGRAALERLLPLASQSDPCARAALTQLARLTLVIPAEGSTSAAPELAVIAEGPLQAHPVLDCATRVLRARGAEPEPGTLGSFQHLSDKKAGGELAVKDGGPLILSAGSYLRALVERSDTGRGPSEDTRQQLHSALRRELGPAPLLLTWVLTPGWLERWLEDPEVKRSPLSEVRALALRGELGDELVLSANVVAENPAGAERIEQFLLATQADLRPVLEAVLGPNQGQKLRTTRDGSRIELHTRIDTRALVSRWLDPALAPAGSASHPLGSAHPQQAEPQPQRAP
jgi:hypothetical protein